jgi:hypothetical protein
MTLTFRLSQAREPALNNGQLAAEGGMSANYAAFKTLGLIGCVSGMAGESATKEVVRKRAVAMRNCTLSKPC